MPSWSTEAVAPAERFAYWRDAVCEAVLSVATENPPGSGFWGEIGARRIGRTGFAAFRSSAHDIVRRPQHIADAPDHFLLSLQLAGEGRLSQGDARAILRPGELALIDGSRPFTVSFPGDVRRLLAVLPRDAVGRHQGAFRLRTVGSGSPYIGLLREYMLHLAAAPGASGPAADLLTEGLCTVLRLALLPGEQPPPAAARTLRREALLGFMRRRLADTELSPRLAASCLGMSVRTVHKLLEDTGQSFGAWVLAQRLEACARTLGEARSAERRIADVAFAWGFGDLAHFNRSFKARFGVTPREYRRAAGGAS